MVPTWDLAIILEGLSRAPCQTGFYLDSVPSGHYLPKAVGDLQALSVSPTCLEFALEMAKAFLYPCLRY